MAIELINITKSYGDKVIFSNLNLAFEREKMTAIMGPSGAGKTTLVNMLLGLQAPDGGEIRGLGSDARVSAVFQEDRLLEHKSGLSNILFVLKNPKQYAERAAELMHAVGLGEDMHKRARAYSGGMKRRLALCRALIVDDFDLMVLDEPFKGLDASFKLQVMEMVKSEIAGKTVILITHDEAEAAFFDSKILDISNYTA
ncbi:MAG: ATP-binding cassette domain-containing protein [Defluviitaleaceae bacterium]|nr:ATP-binding cassette domain-containing protein [Defluviitaleaceae bacterium]